jgi:glycine dehydrogenase subunit 1
MIDDDTSCVVIQNPDFFGNVADFSALAQQVQNKGCLLIAVVPEVMSLGLIKRPGDMGADIVVGEGQSLGNGLNFGGPYVGLFAAREKHIRQMPGRLCGETVDADGNRGFVLTLSTREQHIRRDKATSNICTNSGLCSLAFTAHMTLLGGEGLRQLGQINHARAVQLSQSLGALEGVTLMTSAFFNEFSVRVSRPADAVVNELAEKGVLGGVPAARLLPDAGLDDVLIIAATEVNTEEDIATYAAAMQEVLS